jgi:BON domain-containing protein
MSETPTAYREEGLRQALASDPRVAELELDVTIAGDRVVISGTVPTEDRRAAVAEITRELCPDLTIDNRTVVPSLPMTDDEERVT